MRLFFSKNWLGLTMGILLVFFLLYSIGYRFTAEQAIGAFHAREHGHTYETLMIQDEKSDRLRRVVVFQEQHDDLFGVSWLERNRFFLWKMLVTSMSKYEVRQGIVARVIDFQDNEDYLRRIVVAGIEVRDPRIAYIVLGENPENESTAIAIEQLSWHEVENSHFYEVIEVEEGYALYASLEGIVRSNYQVIRGYSQDRVQLIGMEIE